MPRRKTIFGVSIIEDAKLPPETVTIGIGLHNPPCKHENGVYHTFMHREVFVCQDCGGILHPKTMKSLT